MSHAVINKPFNPTLISKVSKLRSHPIQLKGKDAYFNALYETETAESKFIISSEVERIINSPGLRINSSIPLYNLSIRNKSKQI
jgi:hypothetical protein